MNIWLRTVFFLACLSTSSSLVAHSGNDLFMGFSTQSENQTDLITFEWPLLDLAYRYRLDSNADANLTWAELLVWERDHYESWRTQIQLTQGQNRCKLNWLPVWLNQRSNQTFLLAQAELLNCSNKLPIQIQLLFEPLSVANRSLIIAQNGAIFQFDANGTPVNISSDDVAEQELFPFLRLGFQHILDGWDHLLFVLALLIGIVAAGRFPLKRTEYRARFIRLFWTVTAFTLAHSCTLATVSLGWIPAPGEWIEWVIAVSIAIAAIGNLLPKWNPHQIPLAMGFGLIHGFGFAGYLLSTSEAGVDALMALLGFNLGVEAGQILAITICLPVCLVLLKWRAGWFLVRYGVSATIAAVALFWTYERIAL